MRAFRSSNLRCHSGGAGRTNIDRMRAATTQPPTKRIQNAMAPANQTTTIHLKTCSGHTPPAAGSMLTPVEAAEGMRAPA
jgi:hypothetical protein